MFEWNGSNRESASKHQRGIGSAALNHEWELRSRSCEKSRGTESLGRPRPAVALGIMPRQALNGPTPASHEAGRTGLRGRGRTVEAFRRSGAAL